MRPVRLPPCAAGASPMTRTRGSGSPKDGTGRPQYGWSANDRRLFVATVSRQATSRGQARQTLTRALSSANEAADAANRATSASVVATGVLEVAGSSGQPLPASTGDWNSWPVKGCGSVGVDVQITSSIDGRTGGLRLRPRSRLEHGWPIGQTG